jgi:hypothetical protein
MLIAQIQQFFTTPQLKSNSRQLIFWLSLSLTISLLFGYLGLQEAFSQKYVIQDDARQHVFWMQRFVDPELFPNDLITNYFQSVAPAGYTTVYWIFAKIGVNPILLHKLLPTVLGFITTAYCFGVAIQILPVPFCGFLTSLLLNENLWMKDDLASATPRAFLYPIFVAFLYYLLKRSWVPVYLSIVLLGLFYPHYVFISAGILILRLFPWQKDKKLQVWLPNFSAPMPDFWFGIIGVTVSIFTLLPYALEHSEFGPVISAAEAKTMLEFGHDGRSYFFIKNPFEFWLYAQRSGILPVEWSWLPYGLFPLLFIMGLFLPFVLKNKEKFPLVKEVKSHIFVLIQLAVVSLFMFVVAHVVLFKLHLPSRYTQHGLRIFMALATGIILTILLDTLLRKVQHSLKGNLKDNVLIGLGTFLLLTTLIYPFFVESFPLMSYTKGREPKLYEFLQTQPKDINIASLSGEANKIPSFAQRSVLVSQQSAIPYHLGFYKQFRQRTLDLIQAQYTENFAELQSFIQKYNIKFWLLDQKAFTPKYIEQNNWIMQYQPIADAALNKLHQGKKPILEQIKDRCVVQQSKNIALLSTECLINAQRSEVQSVQ